MGQFIQDTDLAPFATIDAAKAAAMIEDAEAQAVLIAPCLPGLLVVPDGETAEAAAIRTGKLAAAKSILRAAILRWNDAGTGMVTMTTVGPFGQQTQQQARRSMFYPSEIEQLQGICKGDTSKAFSVDTVPYAPATHAPWCSLLLGASYCSCGADLAGYPIYEAP